MPWRGDEFRIVEIFRETKCKDEEKLGDEFRIVEILRETQSVKMKRSQTMMSKKILMAWKSW